jgi:hypothetical protein
MGDNSLLIGNGIVSLLQGVLNGSTAVYDYVQLGAVFDPSPYTSFAEVVDPIGKLGHVGSGGNTIGWRIDDVIAFKVNSGWRYDTNSTTAMTNMLTARGLVLPAFASHYQIPNPNTPTIPIGSVYSVLEDEGQTDRAVPVRFPNGAVYLMWTFWVSVRQQYSITITSP